jgi:hypothetical protein
MRRTSATSILGPIDQPVSLSRLECVGCGTAGVAIIAMQTTGNGAHEAAWCGPRCAFAAGWPFLASERSGEAGQARLVL